MGTTQSHITQWVGPHHRTTQGEVRPIVTIVLPMLETLTLPTPHIGPCYGVMMLLSQLTLSKQFPTAESQIKRLINFTSEERRKKT